MKNQGLYDPSFEHDSCGVGFVADINGRASHDIVRDGLTILNNLVHRGAVGSDVNSGDGAGILTQIPWAFFGSPAAGIDFPLDNPGETGVGMLFMPKTPALYRKALALVEAGVLSRGGSLLGWRDVPVNSECLGPTALQSQPLIRQVFLRFPGLSGEALERMLYLVRRTWEKAAEAAGLCRDDFYPVSLSCRTIIYKGMFVAPQIPLFFPDLGDPLFTSALALVHQRYSTNTFPSWSLAQPFRHIAHNGEINTLQGNRTMMQAREKSLSSPLFGKSLPDLLPLIGEGLSDSAVFDAVFEFLHRGGRSLEHTMMMMVPEAFGAKYHISQDKRGFYEYHAAIMEPWDGPAALVFTDGVKIGASLDRNGLRPLRYTITEEGRIVLASETGVLDLPAETIVKQGRLGPGKILVVDLEARRIRFNNEVKSRVSRQRPYRRWLEENQVELKGFFRGYSPEEHREEGAPFLPDVFGYTLEDRDRILIPMAEEAQEPISSMGNDAALAVLSDRPQLLYTYFKQVFAQVTNPPIDPYRENLVMSLMSFIGREENILEEGPGHCRKLKLPHPVLTNEDMTLLRRAGEGFEGVPRSVTLGILYEAGGGAPALQAALKRLCAEAENHIREGASFLILSDRGVGPSLCPIPALLAVSAVHQHLITAGIRHLSALLVESGEVREVMHFAALIGFGASAVNPYLAFQTVAELQGEGRLREGLSREDALDNYIIAVKKGLLKVMSKMGISTLRSYRGARIFEAVGLSESLVNAFFTGTPSRIGGIGLEAVAEAQERRHAKAFSGSKEPLESGGAIHFRKTGERHLMTPEAVVFLQEAVRQGDWDSYRRYAEEINDTSRGLCTLRGLFRFKPGQHVPLDEVEPVESLVKRFVSSAMSLGSISREAHETIAVAMNRLGGMSNSGEGGENEERFEPLPNGDNANSFVKQVASGRFGVTIGYLKKAGELQIKMAQGAKPGEGGQLPGHKVDDFIASIRYATPGVMLISPPPHHDIYSIEDLSQLIHDLKCANPAARVSVKLVSEVGVGTIAAGVAKAKADMVLISGHDGGTGASPITSIKHTGIPWEIGLAETQQTLILNDLRRRIRIQTDGQLRTGRDVAVAALLGAEEFGFGTVSLVTLGCVMMRKCHSNSCPVGVATQDPELRKRFRGRPEHLENFMRFVARDLREIMASLGFRTLDEMVGRTDLLEVDEALEHYRRRGLDFSRILASPPGGDGAVRRCTEKQDHGSGESLDTEILKALGPALREGRPCTLDLPVRNRNRTVGAGLSSELVGIHGTGGLPEDTVTCRFSGDAGQSFGAFLAPGITFHLRGTANDYLGKGLSGGKIILTPPEGSRFRARSNVITGNVNLFGATSGRVFINGQGGERFAVRNSGAVAVVEGLGDHGCEYMTGGIVVVLGKTGVNFAAGMSGGVAYVLDEDQLFDTVCNLDMVDIEPLSFGEDEMILKELIREHREATGSALAGQILENWGEMAPSFVKVVPLEYRQALARLKSREFKGSESETVTEEVLV